MANCLVTKLKGAVNNNELLQINELRLILGANPVAGDMSLSGNTSFEVYNASGVLVGTTKDDVANAPNGWVTIKNKYDLLWFSLPNWTGVKSIEGYCCPETGGVTLSRSTFSFDIEALKYSPKLYSLICAGAKSVYGDIKYIPAYNGNRDMTIDLDYSNCSGHVEDIASIKATLVNLSGTLVTDRQGNAITTTACLESFAASQVTRGRVSGTCRFYLEWNSYKDITFDPNVTGGYSYE